MNTNKLSTITPKQAGIAPRDLLNFLDLVEKKQIHLHNFVMIKGNQVFAQGSYAPCRRDDLHTLFSMSKSFTSTAIGFAVQEKRLTLTDKVTDFFKEELAGKEELICENMKKMTVHHLITMNTGHTDAEDEMFVDMEKDWCISFLTSQVEKEPGSWFLYNTRATYMLSAIIQKVTGQLLFDYLKPRLFEPLGFSDGIWWEKSPQGINTGGFGLNISVEDLAKFGMFVKNKGFYNGKQLLSSQWFEDAAKPWSDSSNTWEGENKYGYGYQFWLCHIPGVFRGDGAFGQYCVVMPREDMLFITMAGELDMQKILDTFWESICEKKETGRQDPADTDWQEDQCELEKRLNDLEISAYYEEAGIEGADLKLPENVWGKEYVLEENALHITSLRFVQIDSEEDKCRLELKNGENIDVLTVSVKDWTPGEIHVDGNYTDLSKYSFRAGLYPKCHVKGCSKDNAFYMDMLFQETSFQDTWKVTFEENEIRLSVKRNTGFVPAEVCARGTCSEYFNLS
ncbi:MAG: serine hydrolase [Lachnospiraceae bacterium]|nr:serine hydrolase [Lachnospiraceae bacterium]